jgi:hypothetical protein
LSLWLSSSYSEEKHTAEAAADAVPAQAAPAAWAAVRAKTAAKLTAKSKKKKAPNRRVTFIENGGRLLKVSAVKFYILYLISIRP